MNTVTYNFFIVVSGSVVFTFSNLAAAPILPAVGERIRVPSNGVTYDYTVDSKVVTAQLSGGVLTNTVQINAHITVL